VKKPEAVLRRIERDVAACRLCPRLVEHRERVASVRTKRFAGEKYWGRAVPSFGDREARLLVVGLAPAAHGANRTGRLFTGDRSGDWLYAAMHRSGFATQPHSTARGDGLTLLDAYVTAVARCAPPGNKPLPQELVRCRPFLVREIEALPRLSVVVALGGVAFTGFLAAWEEFGASLARPRPKFGHGAEYALAGSIRLLASYHPSQQNTFTGRLTRSMLGRVFRRARGLLDATRIAPVARAKLH
jgi:uracil-DNA glycosylase family 4